MGQDYYNCGVCEEIQGDYTEHTVCQTCDKFICRECMDEEREQFMRVVFEGLSKQSSLETLEEDFYEDVYPLMCSECVEESSLNFAKKVSLEELLGWLLSKTGLTLEKAFEECGKELEELS